jgi:hypothetical protein
MELDKLLHLFEKLIHHHFGHPTDHALADAGD